MQFSTDEITEPLKKNNYDYFKQQINNHLFVVLLIILMSQIIYKNIKKSKSNKKYDKNEMKMKIIRKQYKITCQNVLMDSKFNYHNFNQIIDKKCLKWTYRKKLLFKNFNKNDDIQCLQEIDHIKLQQNHFKKMNQELVYKYRTNLTNGLLISWNKKKFTYIKHYDIDYNNLLKYTEIKDIEYYRNNIGLIVLLQNIQTTNTHLQWDPDYAHVKLVQTNLLLDQLNNLKNGQCMHDNNKIELSSIPIILCGDFNSLPYSDVYKSIKKQYNSTINYNGNDLKEYYKNIINYTNYTYNFKGVIDYIFYTGNVDMANIVYNYKDYLLEGENQLPNSIHPSDHIPISNYFWFQD